MGNKRKAAIAESNSHAWIKHNIKFAMLQHIYYSVKY